MTEVQTTTTTSGPSTTPTPSQSQPEFRPRQNSPTTIKSPQEDLDLIQHSLTARRRLSLRTILHSYNPNDTNKGKSKSNEQVIEEDEEEGSEREEEVNRMNKIDWENYQNSKSDPIDILKVTKNGIRKQFNVDNDDEFEIEFEKEYVWDVLFENQRGIYMFGKGYFSSSGLLPADPSAFTRPSDNIPSASSLGRKNSDPDLDQGATNLREDAGPAEPSSTTQSSTNPATTSSPPNLTTKSSSHKTKTKPRSNKTSYTLETYQPPLPEWTYLTPWMINMRTGTDELGWRYNSWFKKKGWSSHTGPLGWGGWVRRREWIRLRGIGTTLDQIQQEKNKLENLQNRERVQQQKGNRLKDVLNSENMERNVQDVLVVMGKFGLDRQRLQKWSEWLDGEKKDSEAWRRLERLCQDEAALNNLRKQFTYPTSFFPLFLETLSNHSIHIPTTQSISSSSNSSTSNPSTPSTSSAPNRPPPIDDYEPFRSLK